jgi:murein DD-endopeptidase MepM/ murein hydrolase activator NlpD
MRNRLAVLGALGLALAALASGASGASGAGEFAFFPQAGILWRDLYPANFVDLDPGPGLRDYACGTQTYDGHTGTDTTVRSFREMDIGVPVFAALDGRVISVQDDQYDRNYGPTVSLFDNHVVVEHATGRFTIYGHLRKGIKLKRNDRVVAGQQIGWTASSGNSSWPHLHFTSQVDSAIHEPFTGECNPGESGWVAQVPYPLGPYAKDFLLSAKPLTGKRDLPHDQAVRTGTFVRGTKAFYSRVEIGAAFAPGDQLLRVLISAPDGRFAGDAQAALQPAARHGHGYWWFSHRVELNEVGTWRVQVLLGGATIVDRPFTVVAKATHVRNRAPHGIRAELVPASPSPRGVVECRVTTVLAGEDPDFDIIRYRYRWTVGGRLVRAVRSAALSDVLRKGAATSGKSVRCSVTPSDGRLSGRTASISAVSR